MQQLIALIMAHQFMAGLVAFWLGSAAVSSMPAPDDKSGKGYRWAYGTLHVFAANLNKAFGDRIASAAGVKVVAGALVVALTAFALYGCAAVPLHPGAVNMADSAAYDALTAAQAVVDASRVQYQAGTLPQALIPAVDAIAKAYDVAYPAWDAWRSATMAGKDAKAQLTALNAALAALNSALAGYQKTAAQAAKGGTL